MIVIGHSNLDPEQYDPDRWCALETSMMAIMAHDKLIGMWSGKKPGRDLLAVMVQDPRGNHFLMGRVRVHVDDKVTESRDFKVPLHLLFVDIPLEQVMDGCNLSMTRFMPDCKINYKSLEGQGPEGFGDALEQMALKDGNWAVSLKEIDQP